MKAKFTVVLLRPDYITSDTPYGQDIYVALIEADGHDDAVRVAQQEVFKADRKDGLGPDSLDDYALVVMFEGHHSPVLFGWQL